MARHTEYNLIKQQKKHVKALREEWRSNQHKQKMTCDDVNSDGVFTLLGSWLRKAASVIAGVLKDLETNHILCPVYRT